MCHRYYSTASCSVFSIYLGIFFGLLGLSGVCMIISGGVCMGIKGYCNIADTAASGILGGGVLLALAAGLCGGFVFFGPD